MRKALRYINFALLFVLLFVLGYIVGQRYDLAVDQDDKLVGITYTANEQKLRRLMSLIDNQYLEEVDSDSLVESAIRDILGKLDPHSSYIDEGDAKRLDEEMKGSFVGVGIQYRIFNDTIVVTRVVRESPNVQVLQPGDKLISANRVDLVGANALKAKDVLQGEVDTNIQGIIIRKGKKKEVVIARADIEIPSVVAQHMVNDTIGYIKIIRFGEKTAVETNRAIRRLQAKGMQSLILDLRGNPGGIMSSAQDIADEFLHEKELIVYIENKDKQKEYFYASNKGNFEDKPVFVLIDEGSASASEIVAGALQEYSLGTIVGRRSFGKGLVQREISLGDGTKLRLSTARYFTPSGRSIQKPFKENRADYDNDFYERWQHGELHHADSMLIDKTLRFKTPSGKIVYGGGGIVPDVFVPIESDRLRHWIYALNGLQVVNDFVFAWTQQEQEKPDWSLLQWESKYNAEQVLQRFLQQNRGLDPQLTAEQKKDLAVLLKAYIARQLDGDDTFYKILNSNDPMVQKVLNLPKK